MNKNLIAAGDRPFPLDDFLRLAEGEPPTTAIIAWQGEYERREAAREKLGLVDLGQIMLEGVTPPKMLVDGLPFVVGVHTEMFGPKANGKTWLALMAAKALILRGEHVVWVDKEMGSNYMAGRLITLGVEPEVVTEFFHYLDHPTFSGRPDSTEVWNMLLDAMQPTLIVFDARTEFLADAGLNENSGTDVAQWDSAYLNPAARRGIATVMIDHVGHAEPGRGRGSGHKGNSAKVELQVECTEKFGPTSLGKMKVLLRKNTHAATIPESQTFEVGGEAQDNGGYTFVFRAGVSDQDDAKSASQRLRFRRLIETMIEKKAFAPTDEDSLSPTQIIKLTKGNNQQLGKDLKELSLDELSPVMPYTDGKNAIRYYVKQDEADEFLGSSKSESVPSAEELLGTEAS